MDVHGNRGLCAQPCRLPYSLIDENQKQLDKGYLLSPKDLYSIDYLPELVRCGIKCFKIEGRLKSPEYVAIITKFYRKYIDLVWNNPTLTNKEILEIIYKELNKKNENTFLTDFEEITQVFNRGGFSIGHLSNKPNQSLIFKDKPNHSGFYLGKIDKFNNNKGYITFKTSYPLSIGDKIGINSDSYTISELMINNKNIKNAQINDIITIGRIKGNIKPGMQLYKLQNKVLNESVSPTFKENKEFKKVPLNCKISILKNTPIYMEISCSNKDYIYYEENIKYTSNIIPSPAINQPISKDKILEQLSKTGNTPYIFENIKINLDDGLFLPTSQLNEIRRISLELLQNKILEKNIFNRKLTYTDIKKTKTKQLQSNTEINLLLNILNNNFDYTNLKNINNIYIPLKYFLLNDYKKILINICNKFKTFIYMPSIIRDNLNINFDNIIKEFKLTGFVISHINQIELTQKYNLELIGNYTLNSYNIQTIEKLKNLGISTICITPELNDLDTKELISISTLNTELFVYGKIPFMTTNYCLLGKTNKCHKNCNKFCTTNKKYYLKDRMGLDFRIIPDNLSTITTIYNSKITSFDYSEYTPNYARISILDENPNDIQNIIDTISISKRFEGNEYCGHFNK